MTTLPHSDLIADLWREARSWLLAALRDFHGPAAVAKALARAAQAAIQRRLKRLEALVMKLLLIEAARGRRLEACSAPRSAARPARTARARHRAEDPDDPATWRVRFRPRLPRGARPRTGAVAPPRPSSAADPARAQVIARRLARRLEALRRVLADPRAAIASLARRLAALGAAAYEIARHIALARTPRRSPENPRFIDALVCAHDHCAAFCPDTS